MSMSATMLPVLLACPETHYLKGAILEVE